MGLHRGAILGVLLVLIFTSLKVLVFDLIGINFESQATYISRSLRVELGYETYQGFRDFGSGVNTWLGIRYAASPTGQFRWQPPRDPILNNTAIIDARTDPPQCPQAGQSPYPYNSVGDEDCLFLNVYAPPNAHKLPVMIWIHGGGYGQGNAGEFPLALLSFRKDFVGVAIQYRLGAFGFLSSQEVQANGAVNAGLLDQNFAMQWVQKHIHLFGGNPEDLTLAGQSAGAGAVMLHAVAYDGRLGSSLFRNLIAASPYLPTQYNYSDPVPTNLFYQFAGQANCADSTASASVLDCLRSADTDALQYANSIVSASGPYGTWAFVPVTDGDLVTDQPSRQLALGRINGRNLLTSNMADEGAIFMPQNITTEAALTDFLSVLLPVQLDAQNLLDPYPLSSANDTPPILYATNGTSPSVQSSALLASSFATGYQQVINNIYAELTFVCPSYWLAEAFSPSPGQTSSSSGTKAYKYQYSIPAAPHSFDLVPLSSGPSGNPDDGVGPDSARAILTAWTNFITTGDPSIPNHVRIGSHSKQDDPSTHEKTWHWPVWNTDGARTMVNWNETGGEEYPIYYISLAGGKPVIQYRGEGLRNAIETVDAWSWEMGRGERCETLRQLSMTMT